MATNHYNIDETWTAITTGTGALIDVTKNSIKLHFGVTAPADENDAHLVAFNRCLVPYNGVEVGWARARYGTASVVVTDM